MNSYRGWNPSQQPPIIDYEAVDGKAEAKREAAIAAEAYSDFLDAEGRRLRRLYTILRWLIAIAVFAFFAYAVYGNGADIEVRREACTRRGGTLMFSAGAPVCVQEVQ